MFDELIRELRRLEGTHQVSVPMPADAENYLDRECSSDACLSQFKVHEDDWRDKVRVEEVFCPFCRHAADSRKWFTQDQVEHAKQIALTQVKQRLRGAMRRNTERWNQRQRRDSFIHHDAGKQPADTGIAATGSRRADDAVQNHLSRVLLPVWGHRRGVLLSGLRP